MELTPRFTPEKLYPTGRFAQYGENLRLARDESAQIPPTRTKNSYKTLDAIVVPTNRKVSHTHHAIEQIMRLAAEHHAGTVVFLCSGRALKTDIAKVALRFPNQPWVAVDGTYYDPKDDLQFATRKSVLAQQHGTDLADKRNFALELARSMGWETIFFVDDDVELEIGHLDKAAYLLHGEAKVVGYSVREYPDHSVAMHANQALNNPIDSFIGGGAMAVKTSSPILPYFPHLYNDDWLFAVVHSLLSDNGLVWAGMVKQKRYKPFHSSVRAEHEEAGDLLAEGVFRLVLELKSTSKSLKSLDKLSDALLKKSTASYWGKEITNRLDYLRATQEKAGKRKFRPRNYQISQALQQAINVIIGHGGVGGMYAGDFAAWVQDWTVDLRAWNEYLNSRQPAVSIEEALKSIGDVRYLSNSGITEVTVLKPKYEAPHVLHEYLEISGQENFALALEGHESARYLQNHLKPGQKASLRLAASADKWRYDRPIYYSGVKPSMTVLMLVAAGEPVERIQKSVQAVAKQVRNQQPLQLLLAVYEGPVMKRRALPRYRNVLVSELVTELQNTNVYLRSAILRNSGRSTDMLIGTVLTDALFAYWKCGIPLSHFFVVVNSENEPILHGTRSQFAQLEHIIPDEPLHEYLRQHTGKPAKRSSYRNECELAQARKHLAQKTGFASFLKHKKYLLWTYMLEIEIKLARLPWLLLDDLAHTIEFHDKRGWTSVHDVDSVLCVEISYIQALPSDLYALSCRVAAMTDAEFGEGEQSTECMLVVTGKPHNSWLELQNFRQALTARLTAQSDFKGTYTSLIYKQEHGVSARQAMRQERAIARYIHWLENHHRRCRLIWQNIKVGHNK